MKQEVAIGIDIGGTNVEIGWIDSKGQIVEHQRVKTSEFDTAKELVDLVGRMILDTNAKLKDKTVLGIGIGAPNGNYYNGTIEYAPNLNWTEVIPLAKMFEEKTGLPSKLTNDANAAAYAEMLYGGAKNMSDFLVVTLGTGLGSGIVVGGKVVHGYTGFAGELGHVIVQENDRDCGCGRKGCLETYASATGIVRTVRKMQKEKGLPVDDNLSSKELYSRALKGDEVAVKAFEYTGEMLGKSLTGYIALLSPEAIFITGGLAKAHEILIPEINKVVDKHSLKIFKDTCKILPSDLIEQNAGMLGAAALINIG